MKTTPILLAALLPLPLQAADADLPPALAEAAAATPALARLQEKAADAQRALESGVSSRADVLKAERACLLSVLLELPRLNLSKAVADEGRATLRARLLANADSLMKLHKRQQAAGLPNDADALDARRVLLLMELVCEARPAQGMEQDLDRLAQESEAYWQQQLDGAQVDKDEVIMHKVQITKLRHALLLAQHAALVRARHEAGLAEAAEAEQAQRESDAFLQKLIEEEIRRP